MQRIAVLLLCAGLWSGQAAADACEEVGTAIGGFVGGATGYGLAARLGVASNWVAAGLYGAGIAIAGTEGGAWAATGCDAMSGAVSWYGELSCAYSTYYYDCAPVVDVARSLATDFLMCPACTYDEVFGAFLMSDGAREDFLLRMQYQKQGFLGATLHMSPRDHIGTLSASVLNSYFMGVQAGLQLLQTSVKYMSLR